MINLIINFILLLYIKNLDKNYKNKEFFYNITKIKI